MAGLYNSSLTISRSIWDLLSCLLVQESEGGQKREDKKEQMMMKKCVLTDEESKNIEHKRLRSALDDSAVENSRMRQEILANIVHISYLSAV